MKKHYTLFLAIVLGVLSCTTYEIPEDVASVFSFDSPEHLDFDPEGGSVSFALYCNVPWSYDDEPEWISIAVKDSVFTNRENEKGIRENVIRWTMVITAAPNSGLDRAEVIQFKKSGRKEKLLELEVSQEGTAIRFEDAVVKKICLENWDKNKDGELSRPEAEAVETIGTKFAGNKDIKTFSELQRFTGLTYLENGAFKDCENLSAVVLPERIEDIGARSFWACKSLTTINIPESVSSVGDGAFAGCSSLGEFTGSLVQDNRLLVVNDTVVAFAPAGSDAHVAIPSDVKGIGPFAFYACEGLSSVTIGSNVKKIGADAFANCSKLESIDVLPETPPAGGQGMFDNTGDCDIFVPLSSAAEYRSAEYWRDYADHIKINGDSIIEFEDDNVRQICVDKANGWDTNGDGKLSVSEAANVETIGKVFAHNEVIKSFKELQYFLKLNSIENGAFAVCPELTSIVIPNNVISIEEGAFTLCKHLTSVIIPDGLKRIGPKVFSYCYDLPSILIPSSVEYVGREAFLVCSSLEKFDGPYASLDQHFLIMDNAVVAFAPKGASDDVFIPDSVTSIYPFAFGYCSKIKTVEIPQSVSSIGERAFFYCGRLERFKGQFAFNEGRYLIVRDTLISFAPYNVKQCYDIPINVKRIEEGAFFHCTQLESLTIPSGVVSIGEVAFDHCTGLEMIEVLAATPPTIGSYVFEDTNNCDIIVPDNTLNSYKDKWNAYAERIKEKGGGIIEFKDDTVKQICVDPKNNWDTNGDGKLSKAEAAAIETIGSVFKQNKDIKYFDEFRYFTNVTKVDDFAFGFCDNLISVQLPNTVTEIGLGAFHFCKELSSFEVPDSVVSISDGVFQGCSSLESFSGRYACGEGRFLVVDNCLVAFAPKDAADIVIPDGVTTITNFVFNDCDQLKSVTVPKSVEIIASGVFEDCPNLEKFKGVYASPDSKLLIINDEVVAFAPFEVYDYKGIPSYVKSIKMAAFSNCKKIESIIIPSGVVSIDGLAFWGCQSLHTIELSSELSDIGSYAFERCISLKSVTIPSKIAHIGRQAFSNCASLEFVEIQAADPPKGDKNMFYDTNDCPIYVPAASVSAYKKAEYWKSYADRIKQKNEHEWVDLGLSVKWATCNVGASSPDEYGDYFAWGETEPKPDYEWSTYKWCNGSETTLTKYNTNSSYGKVDNKTELDIEDDAARANWGGSWRMPTYDELDELKQNCTWTWTSNYKGTGVAGQIVTSNKAGYTDQYIFLPAAGHQYELGFGNGSGYWSTSIVTNPQVSYRALYINITSDDVLWRSNLRFYGFSVRPVMK